MDINIELLLLCSFLAFLLWYLYMGLEYFFNSGSLGRNKYTFVFSCFWEDINLHYRAGWKHKRIAFMKQQLPLDMDVTIMTLKGPCITSRDVTNRHGDYDDEKLLYCFNRIHPGGLSFFIKNIVLISIPFLFMFVFI